MRHGFIALVLAAFAGSVAAQTHYRVTDISIPGRSVVPTGINDNGDVVGYSFIDSQSPGYQPFLFSGGHFVNLPFTDTLFSAINDQGQIAGRGPEGAAMFTANSMQLVSGDGNSGAYGINAGGEMAGISSDNAVVFKFGAIQNLGRMGDPVAEAVSINDQGDVVGWSGVGGDVRHAFLYHDNSSQALDPADPYSVANDINNAKEVAGDRQGTDSLSQHAFVYLNGTIRDLGTLAGDTSSGTYRLNNLGQVVGWSKGQDYRAVLFDGTQVLDLNSLLDASGDGWTLGVATDINDHGQIIGTGYYGQPSVGHAFILTPVPEPSEELMLGSGLLLLGILRSARKRPKS